MSLSATVSHARLDPVLRADGVLERLGCASQVAPSTRTLRHIDQAIERVLVHAVPRGTYRTYPMTIEGRYVRVPPSVTLRSRRLAQGPRRRATPSTSSSSLSAGGSTVS